MDDYQTPTPGSPNPDPFVRVFKWVDTERIFLILVLIGGFASIAIYALSVISNMVLPDERTPQGLSIALQFRSAISAFYTEYNRYPVDCGVKKDADFLSDHNLMDVLLGGDEAAREEGFNPRRGAFFDGSVTKSMIKKIQGRP